MDWMYLIFGFLAFHAQDQGRLACDHDVMPCSNIGVGPILSTRLNTA